jgi:hypothetical protein
MTGDNGLGLSVHVYRARHGGCTNGGVSNCFDALTVFGTASCPLEGHIEHESYAAPEVELRRGLGNPYIHCGPTPMQKGHTIGPMFGGNYAATSDSRFGEAVGFYGAVPIHDRYETGEQYDMLSR